MQTELLWKARRKIKRAQARASRLLESIRKAAAKNPYRGAVHIRQTQYFLSPDAKIWAATRALGNMAESHPGLVLRVAQAINMFERCDETVLRRYKRKGDGEPRPLFEFEAIQYARQILGRDALKMTLPLPKWQHQNTHMGRNQAVGVILDKIREGYFHFAVLDIKNCFNSFEEGKIIETLPLPEAVTLHLIHEARGSNAGRRNGRQSAARTSSACSDNRYSGPQTLRFNPRFEDLRLCR